MFQKKTKKQQKTKKLRIYTANSRKPAVIAMWLLFICGFAFAVYKDFTGYQRCGSVCAELCENVLFVER